MSVNYYFACSQCDEKLFIASASAGGFASYLAPDRVDALSSFLSLHFAHDVALLNESQAEDMLEVMKA